MAVQTYNLWVLKSYIISAIAEAKNLNYNSIIVMYDLIESTEHEAYHMSGSYSVKLDNLKNGTYDAVLTLDGNIVSFKLDDKFIIRG
jgi:uncharacterized protein YdeI (BOF family)